MLRALSAVALCAALTTTTATAADNKFAVVTVNNPTPDLTLTFDYRWGEGKWETVKALPPGRAMTFSLPLDAKGKAPGFQLKLNRAIGKAKPVIKTWNLEWKPAARAEAKLGSQYEIFRDLIEREYVWLAEVGRR
ncbi:hypothetical protein GobsT_42270 [Gemmata obscuriglobus]|uniref:Uncharacterized protein n=1 Tax=Gemmata obscuriglobus TaxID=114 RepID=A0A2Z3H218_9BACT|nr:hypothetical protein [Gemmata obscuriglobus]AWM37757.1 hypothetical protein C1280_12635 [Gemmata obscuriglobus]QEG29431.1 hypothetical protein GobsT_42270 [Gemmata obscuriglobus]VTS08536.1 unnamed protein product [Gemmata obscuriglobus UQM 2246]